MALVKVRCVDANLLGKKCSLIHMGEVEVPEDGVLEIESETLEFMLGGGNTTFQLHEDSVVEEEEEEEEDTEDDDSDDEEDEDDDSTDTNTDDTTEEVDETGTDSEVADLKTLSLPELVSLAEEAELDPASYEKFKSNKKLMIKFLKSVE